MIKSFVDNRRLLVRTFVKKEFEEGFYKNGYRFHTEMYWGAEYNRLEYSEWSLKNTDYNDKSPEEILKLAVARHFYICRYTTNFEYYE